MNDRQRLFAHLAAAGLSAGACIATLIEPQWFELLFDSAPDGGDGSLETWVALGVSAAAFAVFAWLARRDWRRVRAARAAASQAG